MEGLQNGFTKLQGVQPNARALQGGSLPQILCATKLEDQAPVWTQPRDTTNQIPLVLNTGFQGANRGIC